jgi:hypothetical protein
VSAADPTRDAPPRAPARGPRLAAFLLLAGCYVSEIQAEGEFGTRIALASGDASPVPRLAYLPGPCPGSPGGCREVCLGPPGECAADACLPVLIDSAAAITMFADAEVAEPTPDRTCFELRSAAGILGGDADAWAAALARFRFDRVPLVRLPRDPAAQDLDWGWRVGNAGAPAYVGGVIGGNLLREFSVRFIHRRRDDGVDFDVAFYREFPGSEEVLADQGRAFVPLQFPGLLLGKDITDVCQAGGESCDYLTVFDRQREASALRPTRMVVDACLAAPPATATWEPDRNRCRLSPGPGARKGTYHSATGATGITVEEDRGCTVNPPQLAADDPHHGRDASLVIATGVPGLILFEDSARRLLQDLELPACGGDGGILGNTAFTAPACIDGYAGALDLPGWPPAGSADAPLLQIRVRSVALVPGLAETTGASACQRLESRVKALKAQCDRAAAGASPRLPTTSACADAAQGTAAVLGEAFARRMVAGRPSPDPDLWITTLVIPADHPMVMAIRRDTNPEALQPDGLLGTAMFADSEVVLDYTGGTPGVRLSCADPDSGACVALPTCDAGRTGAATPAACCYGLPEDLLISLVLDRGAYECCAALSPGTIDELNVQAGVEGREPPCAPASG